MPEYSEDPLLDATLEALSAGPLSLQELTARLDALGLLQELRAEMGDGDLVRAVEDEVAYTDDTWLSVNGTLILASSLTDGLVLTHRLTAEEVTDETVALCPDLEVIDWNAPAYELLLADGRALRCEQYPAAPGESGSMLVGPPGWLAPAAAGDLVAFSRHDLTITVEVISGPLPDDGREVEALRRAAEAVISQERCEEMTPILMEALSTDPTVFRRAVRPVGELALDAGLEQRGFSFGRAGEDWRSAGEAHRERVRQQIGGDLGECCRTRFERCCNAFRAFQAGEGVDVRDTLQALRHGGVAAAFAEFIRTTTSDRSCDRRDFALLLAEPPRAGVAHYLLGVEAERADHALEAEAEYRAALEMDPDLGPAAEAVSSFEIDRGNLRRAVALLQHDQLDPESPVLEHLRELIAGPAAYVGTGRNDPCPCGSGRKYKLCHLGGAGVRSSNPLDLLVFKLALFCRDENRRSRMVALAASASDPDEPELRAAIERWSRDPVIVDIALWDGGIADEYLEERGALLPSTERSLLEATLATARRLYEVTEVERGSALGLRDTTTGKRLEVRDHLGSREAAIGDLLLGRVVELEGSPSLTGQVVAVPLAQRAEVMAVLDDGGGADALARWYGRSQAIPRLANREGERLVLCRGEFASAADEASIPEALVSLLEVEGDHFVERFQLEDGETILRASVTLSDGVITLEANSRERFKRLADRLGDVVPNLSLLDYDEQDPRIELMRRRGGGNAEDARDPAGLDEPDSSELTELLKSYMQQRELKWLDESIPALGGLTPKQARDDPTRREDLMRLLREFEQHGDGQGAGGGFDVARLRALLNLGGEAGGKAAAADFSL